jgi:tetratricopeptide (TPR) repeat protein
VLAEYAWKKFGHERSRATTVSSFDASPSIESLKRAIELSADTVDRYRIQLGDVFFAMQEYRLAYDEYRKALVIRNTYERYPGTPDHVLYYQTARTLERVEDYRQALWFLSLSLMLESQFEPARDLAFDLEMKRRTKEQQQPGE